MIELRDSLEDVVTDPYSVGYWSRARGLPRPISVDARVGWDDADEDWKDLQCLPAPSPGDDDEK